MTDLLNRLSSLSPRRLALLIMELQSKLEAADARHPEPIAIIGMSCRFPGADSPEAFWQLLQGRVDAVREVPRDRFDVDAYYDPDPGALGKIASRWGGFLEGIDRFDAAFFGIAPREAASMDPQQRLLLETTWEAFERGGYAPDDLGGSATGVFVGLCNSDYYLKVMGGDPASIDAYAATGNAHSIAAGRLSYVLGLQGPSIVVDTACSSSLVALHLAVQSLRAGECRMAVAGGANVIIAPDTTITLSRSRMMSADGRCKAFDAAADGFVRSEGCGVVVLKRLGEAVADGDPILAVIRGSAVNQDGRSNGITAPNGPSQAAVIRAALRDAGFAPADVQYVEAHGTGTALGDPIEVQALGAALGDRGDAGPLLIGSVKTNLGHLESAAGIAGLIKLVLSLQHGEIPPQLHLRQPSPFIPWDDLAVRVATEPTAWPRDDRRIGGVSSFGFSGTNAHVIVEAAPPRRSGEADDLRPLHLLKLSATSDAALRELAGNLAAYLDHPGAASLPDIAHTANVARGDFDRRATVRARNIPEAREALHALAAGGFPGGQGVATGTARAARPAFLFTGQGAQYVGMARGLYTAQPVFRATLDRCAELLRPHLDRPILDLIFSDPGSPEATLLDQACYAQPALFAVQYALAELWGAWGIRPAAVAGHSAGEYVAACVAGVLALEDALRLIAVRGRLMDRVTGGAMAAVFASEARVGEVLDGLLERIAVAAVNGPESVVLSGRREQVEEAVERLRGANIEARTLAIHLAAHSPLVDPILDTFEREAATVRHAAPSIDFVSGVSGRIVDGGSIDAAYWRRHLRQPVRFADAMYTLAERGHTLLVEIGPHPTLVGMARQFLPEQIVGLPSLRRGHDDWETILGSLGVLYTAGCAIDWAGFDRPYARQRVVLPTYPFQRERFWLSAQAPRRAAAPDAAGHPLLGVPLSSPALAGPTFEARLSADYPPFLAHHRIHGAVILPSPAFLEMVRAAASSAGVGRGAIADFHIHEALILPERGDRVVQTLLATTAEGATARVFSRANGDERWSLHAEARLLNDAGDSSGAANLDLAAVRARCTETIASDAYYAALAGMGLEFGEDFRGLRDIARRDGEALGAMELPATLAEGSEIYGIHPALLDACFHLLGAPLGRDLPGRTYLLIAIERFRLHARPGRKLWNHTTLRTLPAGAGETFVGDVRLYDEDGRLVIEALGLHLRLATPDALARAARQRASNLTYQVRWQPMGRSAEPDVATVATAVAGKLEALAGQHGLGVYDDLLPELDALAATYVVRALHRLGMPLVEGTGIGAGDIAARLGVLDRHRRLLDRLLAILAEEGWLRRNDLGWDVARRPDLGRDPEAWAADLLARHPSAAAEIGLTARCGATLAEVLRGAADPLQLLFQDGSTDALENLYRHSPFARVFNSLMGAAVEGGVGLPTAARPLRVLEVGAGSGATTVAALAVLPDEHIEYWFTDISPLFLERAREKFAGDARLRYRTFDLERDPAEQGLTDGTFDLVIAANVLHATCDVRRSLARIRRLLVPGGRLALLEGTRPRRWVDITFGLTEGWWRFADVDLRPAHPLLSRAAWARLLPELGFGVPATIGYAEESAIDQIVILADAVPEVTDEGSHWLILAEAAGIADALAARLRARSARVTLIPAGCDPLPALRALGQQGARLRVVLLDGLAMPDGAAAAEEQAMACYEGTASALAVANALAAAGGGELWLVTRGAQPAGGTVVAPAQAVLWGLGRGIAVEHPEIWGGLIDLDPTLDVEAAAAALLRELDAPDGEDQLVLRSGQRLVPRLAPTDLPACQPAQFRADASYVITGGLGGIGLKLARWMVEGGARHLVLVGRTSLPPRESWSGLPADSRAATQVAAIRAIESLGASVCVVAADVAERRELAPLFARFGSELPPLRGIVHAAAHLGADPLSELSADTLRAMLRPKVAGTLVLHELSDGAELDFFALFSSTTALIGSRRLAHYAAANTFLDAFAHWRNAAGLRTLSINWGTWDEMRVASEAERLAVADSGLHPLASAQALAVFGDLLGGDEPQVAVAAVDWPRLKGAYEARRPRPMLALLGMAAPAQQPELTHPATEAAPDLARRLAELRPEHRRGAIADFVQSVVARTLGVEAGRAIEPQQGLFQMGLDSLMAVDLKAQLESGIGRRLPSTIVFNYPTIDAMTDYLHDEVLAEAPRQVPIEASVLSASEVTPSTSDCLDELSEEDLEDLLFQRLAKAH